MGRGMLVLFALGAVYVVILAAYLVGLALVALLRPAVEAFTQ